MNWRDHRYAGALRNNWPTGALKEALAAQIREGVNMAAEVRSAKEVSMGEAKFEITKVINGWIVHVYAPATFAGYYVFSTWDEAEKHLVEQLRKEFSERS